MLNFDQNGYLYPYTVIALEFDSLVENFVFNEHRGRIFEEFKSLLSQMSKLGLKNAYLWVDGSFVSKRQKPVDMDVVVFVESTFYEINENQLRALKSTFESLDCYFVRDFPKDSPQYFVTQFDKAEWQHLFGTDRKKRPKGIVEIKI